METLKITAIKAQVKNPERVSIYVNGSYAFSLNYTQLLDQKLHSGLELTEARIAELKHISDFGKAYERCLIYVMIRPRSVREVQDYCRRKKYAVEDAEAIITKLTQKGYVNDQTFAKAWVESRRLTKATSQRRLRQELQQKGVASSIIDEVLSASTHTDQTALQDMIAKKRKLSRYQDDQKLMQYLSRQGFGFDDIKSALQQLDN